MHVVVEVVMKFWGLGLFWLSPCGFKRLIPLLISLLVSWGASMEKSWWGGFIYLSLNVGVEKRL